MMCKKLTSPHAQRGQALFETAWLLPLVLLSLVFMAYTARLAVVTEHLEIAARYANTIDSTKDTFRRYSLYALYDAASPAQPRLIPQCYVDNVQGMMQDGKIVFDSGYTASHSKIWTASNVRANCVSGNLAFPAGDMSVPIAMFYEGANIAVDVPSFFPTIFNMSTLNIKNMHSQTTTKLSSVTMKSMVACFPNLKDALQASLFHGADGPQSSDPQASGQLSDVTSAAPVNAQPEQIASATCQ